MLLTIQQGVCMKLYRAIAKTSFAALLFLCFFNNCFAERDHVRFVTNHSSQPWVVNFDFTQGVEAEGWDNHNIIGIVNSECQQAVDCTINPGETKKIIYRVPMFDELARNYNGSLTVTDSNKNKFVFVIQGQYFHTGPSIQNNSSAPADVIALNSPKGGDVTIKQDLWNAKP